MMSKYWIQIDGKLIDQIIGKY